VSGPGAVAVVAVAAPDTRGKPTAIDLPGRLEAYSQAQLYARVGGYLKNWKADIGTPVKAGQLIAEIDAPDLDQQLMQAEADVTSAEANRTLSRATLERGQSLIQSGSVSKQDLDQRAADFANKQGLLKSAQANRNRLRVLETYKRIVAPFDGLVTARNTDVGALINAGGGGPALFVVSDTRKLRAYVNVPQSSVPSIKINTKAQISVPEYPGRVFPATVEASAQAVDPTSGTTRMLLIVDNATGEVLAYVGSPDYFAAAHGGANDGVRALRQPGSTLKPFVYAAAIAGLRMTAATLLPDVDLTLETAEGPYRPKNYDGRTHGPVRLREALASSLNVPDTISSAVILPPSSLLSPRART